MIAYVCYTSRSDGFDSWDKVTQIVSDELVAMQWVEEFEDTEYESRFCQEYEIK